MSPSRMVRASMFPQTLRKESEPFQLAPEHYSQAAAPLDFL
jgi:hypothetical protein